jgi:hypothetical protein
MVYGNTIIVADNQRRALKILNAGPAAGTRIRHCHRISLAFPDIHNAGMAGDDYRNAALF